MRVVALVQRALMTGLDTAAEREKEARWRYDTGIPDCSGRDDCICVVRH
eukprot:COSAG05_NODE_640_length_8140_cov_15.055590_3_plen_49_part_00